MGTQSAEQGGGNWGGPTGPTKARMSAPFPPKPKEPFVLNCDQVQLDEALGSDTKNEI